MQRPPQGPRLWLAPFLGGIGTALIVAAVVNGLRRDRADAAGFIVLLALMLLVVALSVLLIAEQRGRRSTVARIDVLENRLAAQEQMLTEAVKRDSLTGLRNRFAFYELLDQTFGEALRGSRPLACVLIGLDHFRRLNDRFGHHFGDTVLVTFTRLLDKAVRDDDQVFRYSGDEFVVVMPDVTADQATAAAEEVRQMLKREVFSDGAAAAALTASFGIAVFPAPAVTRYGALIERMEAALVEAKRGGRDRIALGTPNVAEESPA